jgi:hypothetical protein
MAQNPYTQLCQALRDSPDYRETWIANIACMLMDEQQDGAPLDMKRPEVRNAAARRVMDHCFPLKDYDDTAAVTSDAYRE